MRKETLFCTNFMPLNKIAIEEEEKITHMYTLEHTPIHTHIYKSLQSGKRKINVRKSNESAMCHAWSTLNSAKGKVKRKQMLKSSLGSSEWKWSEIEKKTKAAKCIRHYLLSSIEGKKKIEIQKKRMKKRNNLYQRKLIP